MKYAFIDTDGKRYVKTIICPICDAPVINVEDYDYAVARKRAPEHCDQCGADIEPVNTSWLVDENYDGEHYGY